MSLSTAQRLWSEMHSMDLAMRYGHGVSIYHTWNQFIGFKSWFDWQLNLDERLRHAEGMTQQTLELFLYHGHEMSPDDCRLVNVNVKSHRASSSRFMGVSYDMTHRKWQTRCLGRHLGWHKNEFFAACEFDVELRRWYFEPGALPLRDKFKTNVNFPYPDQLTLRRLVGKMLSE